MPSSTNSSFLILNIHDLRACLFRGVLHVRPVQTHVVWRRRQAPEPRLLRSLQHFLVFFLSDLLWLTCCALDNGAIPCSIPTLPAVSLSLASYFSPSSVHLKLLPSISISRISLKLLCHVGTRHSPMFLRSHPPIRTLPFSLRITISSAWHASKTS